MIILGIDPGSTTIGFGLVGVDGPGGLYTIDYGVIDTGKGGVQGEKLSCIRRDLTELVEQSRPDVAAVELLMFGANVTTAMQVAEARGVILMVLAEAGVEAHGYTPGTVKLAVTGDGRAKKPEVQAAVRDLLKLDSIPRPDDAADGLALGICHAQNLALVG